MIFIISCPQFIHGCWMVHQQWIGLVQNWKKFPQFCWSCHLRSFQWGSSGCTEQNSGVKRKHTIMTGITATLLLWANVLDISPGKCQKRCKVCDKHELRHIKECARGKMKICDVAHVIVSRVYSDQVTCIIVVQSQQYNAGPVGDLENQRWESDTRSYTKTALKKNLFNVGLACVRDWLTRLHMKMRSEQIEMWSQSVQRTRNLAKKIAFGPWSMPTRDPAVIFCTSKIFLCVPDRFEIGLRYVLKFPWTPWKKQLVCVCVCVCWRIWWLYLYIHFLSLCPCMHMCVGVSHRSPPALLFPLLLWPETVLGCPQLEQEANHLTVHL